MTEKITNIARNTSYLTVALILQKVISFTYFALLARYLPPEDLGKYYFAISFTTIFAIFLDLGLGNVLTREVAKNKEQAQKLLSNILAIKITLTAATLAVMILLINLLGYQDLTRDLLYLSAISMVLDSFTLTFFSVSRGFHNLSFESIASIVFQVIVIIFGLVAIKLNLGLKWLMGALVAASVFNFVYSASFLRFKWEMRLVPIFEKIFTKNLLIITAPFAIAGILQRLFTYFDTVMLSYMAGDAQVGFYQISFKIIFALQFLPLAFVASLYPAFAAYWSSNRDQLVITFERAFNYLTIISLPIFIGIAVLADKIILIFRPEFEAAVLPLIISIFSLPFIFLGFPTGALLNACDRQKINTVNTAIALAVSVLLNIILIPRYQAIGASITVVIANAVMFGLSYYQTRKVISIRQRRIIIPVLKSVFAAAIMGLFVFYTKSFLNFFLVIPMAGLIYFVILFLLGGFRKEDILSIWKAFAKKSAL